MTYLPGKAPCYRCLYPERPEDLVPNCATAGVLGVLPGVMGSLQATEAIKVLLGIGNPLAGRLLVDDALSSPSMSSALRAAQIVPCAATIPRSLRFRITRSLN